MQWANEREFHNIVNLFHVFGVCCVCMTFNYNIVSLCLCLIAELARINIHLWIVCVNKLFKTSFLVSYSKFSYFHHLFIPLFFYLLFYFILHSHSYCLFVFVFLFCCSCLWHFYVVAILAFIVFFFLLLLCFCVCFTLPLGVHYTSLIVPHFCCWCTKKWIKFHCTKILIIVRMTNTHNVWCWMQHFVEIFHRIFFLSLTQTT